MASCVTLQSIVFCKDYLSVVTSCSDDMLVAVNGQYSDFDLLSYTFSHDECFTVLIDQF